MEVIKIVNFIIMLIFFACYAYQFAFIPISLFGKNKVEKNSKSGIKLHRYAILIAARNEESVIANLTDSLKKQTYPANLTDIYVVADNCNDNTARIAEEHGAIVYERNDTEHIGKGYALNFLLKKIPDCYDAYIVFDADNIVDKNYISEINKTFSCGYEIITSYRNSKNYGDNWISAGYGLWFLREAQYLNRPRLNVGSSCGVSGTGFLFSANILKKCGGWNFFLLTEDIEFTAYNIIHGEQIGYCRNAVFYDEQPTSLKQSIRQRMRWVQGYIQVLHKYGIQLINGCFHRHFSCFDMLMNIAPAALLTWLSIIVSTVASIASIGNGAGLSTILFSISQNILNICLTVFMLGLLTTITEWKNINCTTFRKILSIFTFPFFMLTYIPISAAAIIFKPEWTPITHNRTISISNFTYTAEERSA